MPLWLDLLRTPMAAPETRALKSMRMTILAVSYTHLTLPTNREV